MLMLVVVVLGASWWLVSIASAPMNRTGLHREHNARVLQQAKETLIGWVAHQAVQANEANPGRFPCPQNWGDVGGAFEGREGASCIPTAAPPRPAIGWLPWRTLGIPAPRDAAGEQLWYVVAPGWARPNSGASLLINSNSTSQLTLNGQSVVALLIAPGNALSMQACGGVAARLQARTKLPPANDPDPFEYLECENAAAPVPLGFVNSGPAGSFNDQMLAITVADVMPAIEAAVAARFERDMAPQIRTAYAGGLWPAAQLLPFAAPFGDPSVTPTDRFQGAPLISAGSANVMNGSTTVTLSAAPSGSMAGRYFRVQGSADAFRIAGHAGGTNTLTLASPFTGPSNGAAAYHIFAADGLLPVTSSCSSAGDPRCDPAFVYWRNYVDFTRTGGGFEAMPTTCTAGGTPSTITCTVRYFSFPLFGIPDWMEFTMDVAAENVGRSLRRINPGTAIGGVASYSLANVGMNADALATLRISGRTDSASTTILTGTLSGVTCGVLGVVCLESTISVPIALFSDHPVVDPTNSTYNWFYRNNWHHVTYYAAAANVTPSGPRSCTTSGTCLAVAFHPHEGRHRGIIILSGRSLDGTARPNGTLGNWLEGPNADGASPFAARAPSLIVNRTFNDRIAVIDRNP